MKVLGNLFGAGDIVLTAAVYEYFTAHKEVYNFVIMCLGRHLSGDWGDMDSEDKKLNDESVKNGERLMSAYKLPNNLKSLKMPDDKLWIITEADRSATTVLFPSDY